MLPETLFGSGGLATKLRICVLLFLFNPASAVSATDFSDQGENHAMPISGEILDIAIEHCRRGEWSQAQTLFIAIQSQLNPPPVIRDLISDLQRSGCLTARAPNHSWSFSAMAGYDNNVSQGIKASSLSLGYPTSRIELVLDDEYRAIPSSFLDATVERNWEMPNGTSFQVASGTRRYANAKNYNLSHVAGSIKTQLDTLGRPVEVASEWLEVWLGGLRYHSALTFTAETPLVLGASTWNLAAVAQAARFHTQPQQNADQVQLGVAKPIRMKTGQAAIFGISGIWDRALGQRAGGDRNGFKLHAASAIHVHPWRLTGRFSYTHWATHQPFLPGLFDQKRRNQVLFTSFQAEYPLTQNQAVQFDLQLRKSNDTIGLYTYQSVAMSVRWNAQF
jgi:hypothetical protein